MNIKNLLGKFRKENTVEQEIQPATAAEAAAEENTDDEVTTGTKVKVVAALLVAGFAAYVAWWVQEPTTMRADLFAANAATEQTAQATSETQTANTQEVSIINFAYDPAEITVDKGTTVVWTNKDAVPHTVVGADFNSGTLESGQSFSHIFDQDGTFAYACVLHPQMKGTVIVGLGVSAAATSESMQTEIAVPMLITEQMAPSAGNTEENLTFGTEQLLPAAAEFTTEELQPQLYSENTSPTDQAKILAAVKSQDKLAKSGPEDILYVGMILAILFLNRKRLLPKTR
jgi:plastocyanin